MRKKIIVTLSYGDYTCGVGGTDKAILAQVKILNDAGYNVISLSPCIERKNSDYWDVLYDSKYIGVYSNSRLLYYLSSIKKAEFECFIIHHLKNIDISRLMQILDYLDIPVFMYLHDYYTICPKNGLILESGLFCGEGFPNEDKCRDCKSFIDSKNMLESYQSLLKILKSRIKYILPSDSVCNIWIKHYPEYMHQVKVIYHQNPIGVYVQNSNLIKDEEPIRIAFVGYQKPLKGWKQFKDATAKANQLGLNEQFYQFGWGEEKFTYIEQVDVDFKKSITAMIDALRERKIQVAVLWSLWPETYSYTFYEALAANCFVITNENSGNICSQVKERDNGIVAKDLSEILCNESKLRKLVNGFRANEHIVPEELIENEDFLSLISDTDWCPKRVRKVVDYSNVLTLLKKSKRMIKDWIKRV